MSENKKEVSAHNLYRIVHDLYYNKGFLEKWDPVLEKTTYYPKLKQVRDCFDNHVVFNKILVLYVFIYHPYSDFSRDSDNLIQARQSLIEILDLNLEDEEIETAVLYSSVEYRDLLLYISQKCDERPNHGDYIAIKSALDSYKVIMMTGINEDNLESRLQQVNILSKATDAFVKNHSQLEYFRRMMLDLNNVLDEVDEIAEEIKSKSNSAKTFQKSVFDRIEENHEGSEDAPF